MRIVSLLPSTTEILFAVGAGDDLVGVTFECDYPVEARSRHIVSLSTLPENLSPAEIDAIVKTRMAAGEELYRLDERALDGLNPDLVVTQDLCAVCAVAVDSVDAALDHLGCRAEVLTIDPMTLEAVLDSIIVLGAASGNDDRAADLVGGLRARLAAVGAAVADRPPPRIAVLEWTDPLFGAGHWVPDMVAAAGARSVLGTGGENSRQVDAMALHEAAPDIVVVAPCGYRLDGATQLARDLHESGVVPTTAQLWAVDADAMFVRPGPRLVDGVEVLAGIAHPDAVEPNRAAATLIPRP